MVKETGRFAVLVLLALGCSAKPAALATPAAPVSQSVDPDAPLVPLDPRVRVGQLANGLRYLVLRADGDNNTDGGPRTALVVDAGTDDETPAQRGAAVELSAAIFPLIRDSEAAGADASDYSTVTFDATVVTPGSYGNELGMLLTGLREVADGITFDAKFRDPEEEFRDAKAPKHRDDDILGRPTPPKKFDPHAYDHIKSFYQTWYRPDRMTIVVVGNLDANAAVKEIERTFGSMKRPAAPAPPRILIVRPRPPGLTVELGDSGDDSLKLSQRFAHHRARGERGFRAQLAIDLLHDVIAERVAQLTEMDRMGIKSEPLDSTQDLVTFEAEGGLVRDFALLFREIERLRMHGIDASELAAWQSNKISPAPDPDAFEDEPSSPSWDTLRDQLVAHARGQVTFAAADVEARLVRSLTIDEVNAAARAMQTEHGRSIAITAESITESEVHAADIAARSSSLERYSDLPHRRPLLAITSPGTIKSTREDSGLVILELGNGARVIVKPDENERETHVVALGPGGWGQVPFDAGLEHMLATEIVLSGGFADMTQKVFTEALRGRSFDLWGFVWRNNHYVRTAGAPARLEVMLQTVHLALANPRKDPDAFERWKRAVVYPAPGEHALKVALQRFEALEGDLPPPLVTRDAINKLDLDRVFANYVDHVGDMTTTTFVITGPVDAAAIRGLIATYLASIPSTGTRITSKLRTVQRPKVPAAITAPHTKAVLVLDFVGPVIKSDLQGVERNIVELENALDRQLSGERTVQGSIAVDRHAYLRVTVDPSVSVQAVQKAIDDLANSVDDNTLEWVTEKVTHVDSWSQSLDRAVARGEDPIAAAIYLEKRYANAVDGSGIKAAAKLFRKPAAVLRGTP